MRSIKKTVLFLYDLCSFPLILVGAIAMRITRKCIQSYGGMPVSKFIFEKTGVFPIQDHYYEPLFLFNDKTLTHSLKNVRNLPGIKWNLENQLALLASFHYKDELAGIPVNKGAENEYYYRNGFFEYGDADYLYNMIRHFRPEKIIEIGSGYSTLMAAKAIEKNRSLDNTYACKHLCIEPYEAEWLEKINVEVQRKRVEHIDRDIFTDLEENDILFIDSSHIIRPQGDVLIEYAEILPVLNRGVVVHIHDIFTPYEYPELWLRDKRLFWNEQYLAEAFLCLNDHYEILGALNLLHKNHFEQLSQQCPGVQRSPQSSPGSLWLRKLQ